MLSSTPLVGRASPATPSTSADPSPMCRDDVTRPGVPTYTLGRAAVWAAAAVLGGHIGMAPSAHRGALESPTYPLSWSVA